MYPQGGGKLGGKGGVDLLHVEGDGFDSGLGDDGGDDGGLQQEPARSAHTLDQEGHLKSPEADFQLRGQVADLLGEREAVLQKHAVVVIVRAEDEVLTAVGNQGNESGAGDGAVAALIEIKGVLIDAALCFEDDGGHFGGFASLLLQLTGFLDLDVEASKQFINLSLEVELGELICNDDDDDFISSEVDEGEEKADGNLSAAVLDPYANDVALISVESGHHVVQPAAVFEGRVGLLHDLTSELID